MYDLDAIEAINFEQLATATDRLLVLGPRPPQRFPRGSAPLIRVDVAEPTLFVRMPRPSRAAYAAYAVATLVIYAALAITAVRLLA